MEFGNSFSSLTGKHKGPLGTHSQSSYVDVRAQKGGFQGRNPKATDCKDTFNFIPHVSCVY